MTRQTGSISTFAFCGTRITIFLRKVFPFDVKTDKLNCDIGMGYVERTGHDNTSWDEAKFRDRYA